MNTNIKALSNEELETISGGVSPRKILTCVALGICAVSSAYLAVSLFQFKRDVNNAIDTARRAMRV